MKTIIFLFFIFISAIVYATNEIPAVVITPSDDESTTTITTSSLSQGVTKVASPAQIANTQAQNLLDVLTSLGGVTVIEPNGIASRATVSLRGFGDNSAANTLIMLDGQPMENPDLAPFSLNSLALSDIYSVEASPSSAAVLYGDQAVGGVINIITKKPTHKDYRAQVAYGSFASRQAQVALSDLWGSHFGYRVEALYNAGNNYRRNNAEQNNAINLALSYDYAAGETTLYYHKLNQHLRLPGGLTWQQVEQDPRQPENYIAYNNQDSDIFQLSSKYNLPANWLLQMDGALRLMQGVGAYQGFEFAESRHAGELQPKISGVINVGNYSLFPIVGLDWSHGRYAMNDFSSAQNMLAEYGQISAPIFSKLMAIVGARQATAFYDIATGSGVVKPRNQAFITSAELSWQINSWWRSFVRRADSFRFPKVDEQLRTIDRSPLKTQFGTSYESGLVLQTEPLQAALTLYQLDLQHEIVAIPIIIAQYDIYNTNLDPTRRRGLTFDITFSPVQQWQLNAAYNFVNAKFNSGSYAGSAVPFVAKNSVTFNSSYQLKEHWHFFGEGIYTGARYAVNDVTNSHGLLGGFTTYNCGVSYVSKHWDLGLRVNNLTNKLYYGYVATSYHDGPRSTLYYPAAGMSALLGLNVKV